MCFKYNKYTYQHNYKKLLIKDYDKKKKITKIVRKYTHDPTRYIYNIVEVSGQGTMIIVQDNLKNVYAVTYFSKLKDSIVTEILVTKNVTKISQNKHFVLCLCQEGIVYSVRPQTIKKLKYVDVTIKRFVPEIKEKIVDIECNRFVFILTDKNKLYRYNINIFEEYINSILQQTFKNIKKFAIKSSNNKYTLAMMTKENDLYIYGQIAYLYNKRMITIKNIRDFKLNYKHLVFKRDDKYFSIGFRYPYHVCMRLSSIGNSNIVKYKCSDLNTVFITDKNEAYVFQKSINNTIRWYGKTDHKDIIDFHLDIEGLRLELIDKHGNCHYFARKIGWRVRQNHKIYVAQYNTLFDLCILCIKINRKIFSKKRVQILPKDIRKCL